jgi:hypothetical protein
MLFCCCLRPGGVESYEVFLDLRCLWVQQWLRALSAYSRGDKVVSNDFRMRANLVIGFILVAMLGGCAQNASVPHRDFERIEIVVLIPETSTDAVPSKGESAATGAAAGAVGGVMGISGLSSEDD